MDTRSLLTTFIQAQVFGIVGFAGGMPVGDISRKGANVDNALQTNRKTYMIYDERYRRNPDRAIVLECFQSSSRSKSKKRLFNHPKGSVLVAYELAEDGKTCINPEVVK
jgi:hypothetical protein